MPVSITSPCRSGLVRTTCISGAICLLSLLATVAMAQDAWWEKGLNMLKSLNGEQVQSASGLSDTEISDAFRQALRLGAENVVQQLGRTDGFNSDPRVHIPLPDSLNRAKHLLDKVGMSAQMVDLELKLNRAAEAATPRAKALFLDAIGTMSFADIRGIYEGPADAATRYFRERMTPELSTQMHPIVTESLSQVGAIQTYDRVMGRYQTLPFVPDIKTDLSRHVIEKGMDGIFFYLAREEAAIRQDPARRTTELLQRVFGARP